MMGLVITVGNDMRGDDALGPLLAEVMNEYPIPGWQVINGGVAPENYLHRVDETRPDMVVVVDAAEMELPPGSIRLISENDIVQPLIMTTHNLPLSFFIGALKEIVPEVFFVGIQPQNVTYGEPLSAKAREAVMTLYHKLHDWKSAFPSLIMEED